MGEPAAKEEKSRLRTALRYSWLLVALAALYSGWTLLVRWDADRRLQREMQQQKLEADRRTVEALGGDRFEILHFYASPPVVRPGQDVQICYGVSNAKTVRIEPPAGSVWPSFSRCLYAQPQKDTTYTLTIEDASGKTKSESLTVYVR